MVIGTSDNLEMKSNEWIQVHLKWNNKSNSNITFNFTIDFDFVWSIPYDRSIRICIQLETTYLSDIEISKKSRIEHNTTHSIYRNRCLKPTGLHQSSSPKIFFLEDLLRYLLEQWTVYYQQHMHIPSGKVSVLAWLTFCLLLEKEKEAFLEKCFSRQ